MKYFVILLLALLAFGFAGPAPTGTFSEADGATVHKSAGVVSVSMAAADLAGLASSALSGAYESASSTYRNAPQSASVSLSWYVGYYPTGDYTFTGSAVGSDGQRVSRAITLHLVN